VLQQPKSFGIKLERGPLLVDRGYAREKLRVEEYEVRVRGEFGSLNAPNLLQRVVGIGAGDALEGLHDSIE
jgi:hypothetical protein